MAGFLDFVDTFSGAIPSWLTGLLVKKPKTDVSAALPYYQMIAEQAAQTNALANEDRQFYNENYRPSAVAFNQRAQGVGGQADLAEAADRGGANFRTAFDARRAAVERDMAGVNPNSGGAMARRGALDASFAPGVVNAMNQARSGREQYGDTLRAQALPFLATRPNYGTGMTGLALAGAGTAGVAGEMNKQYRQQAGDVVKAIKLPGDAADEKKRQGQTQGGWDEVLKKIMMRFPSNTYSLSQFESDAANMHSVEDGV